MNNLQSYFIFTYLALRFIHTQARFCLSPRQIIYDIWQTINDTWHHKPNITHRKSQTIHHTSHIKNATAHKLLGLTICTELGPTLSRWHEEEREWPGGWSRENNGELSYYKNNKEYPSMFIGNTSFQFIYSSSNWWKIVKCSRIMDNCSRYFSSNFKLYVNFATV